MRVVLDTSVFIAALRSDAGASRIWLESVLERRHVLLLSEPLILEYEAVAMRPQMLKATGLQAVELEALLDTLCLVAQRVELHYRTRPSLSDPDDEIVLETAVLGRADCLLTFNVRDFKGAAALGVSAIEPGPALRQIME